LNTTLPSGGGHIGTGISSYRTNQNLEKEDWREIIADLAIHDATFFAFATKGKQQPTINRRFNWSEYFEDAPIVRKGVSDGDWIATASGRLQVPFDTRLGSLTKNVVIIDDTTENYRYYRLRENPEKVRVATNDYWEINMEIMVDSGSVVDPRGFGMTMRQPTQAEVQQIVTTGLFKVLYPMVIEGSHEENPILRLVSDTYNYVTTFMRETKTTFTKAMEQWKHNMTHRDWQIAKLGIAFAMEIESAFWIGKGFNNAIDENTVGNLQGTKGFLNFEGIRHRVHNNATRPFDYIDFIKFCERDVMEYNRKESLTGWVNPSFLTFIAQMIYSSPAAQALITFDSKGYQNSYGINVKRLITPHCEFHLLTNNFLRQHFGNEPILVSADMEKITTRYMSGGGHVGTTTLSKDLQPNKAKYHLDELYGIYGIEVTNPQCHAVLRIKNVA
jgi:hypothetical protein